MQKLLIICAQIVFVLLLVLTILPSAYAQTGCTQQAQTSLLSQFSDNAPTGSIRPSSIRNVICTDALAQNTTDLRSFSTAQYPQGVTRLAFATAGDAPPVAFMPDVNHVCSTDDGGYCVAANGGGFWLAQYSGPADIRQWGNSSNDWSIAINACETSIGNCHLPAGTWSYSNPILLTGHKSLIGDFADASEPPSGGSILLCANAALDCVHTSGGGNVISNIAIQGPAGVPVSGNVGLFSDHTHYDTYQNVNIYNHDVCFEASGSNAASGGGISTHVLNPAVSLCATHYWEIVGYPALNVENGRTGSTGANDYTTPNEYIYATVDSTCSSGGCGPNGIYFINHLFNPGGIAGRPCFLSFANFAATPSNSDWKFIGDHIEDIAPSGAMLCSDSTVPAITAIDFVGTDVITTSGQANLFNVSSSTIPSGINVTGGCVIGNINLSPSAGTWNKIYVRSSTCPINVSINPTGSGNIIESSITDSHIGTFSFAPASSTKSRIAISDNEITTSFSADWTSDTGFSFLNLSGNSVSSAAAFTAGTNTGIVDAAGNNFPNTLTISGQWYSANFNGNVETGTLSNTATGNLIIIDPRNGLITSGAGAASKYVCVDASNKIVISAAAC